MGIYSVRIMVRTVGLLVVVVVEIVTIGTVLLEVSVVKVVVDTV